MHEAIQMKYIEILFQTAYPLSTQFEIVEETEQKFQEINNDIPEIQERKA